MPYKREKSALRPKAVHEVGGNQDPPTLQSQRSGKQTSFFCTHPHHSVCFHSGTSSNTNWKLPKTRGTRSLRPHICSSTSSHSHTGDKLLTVLASSSGSLEIAISDSSSPPLLCSFLFQSKCASSSVVLQLCTAPIRPSWLCRAPSVWKRCGY